MKKERIRLETLEIPDIPEDDIVEVITNVKELLQKRAVKKYESSILKSLRELLYVHGWKSIVLQGGLTLLVALAVWLCLPNGYKMNSVAFLSLGSSLLSVAVTVEVFRCDIYGMKELEMASPYSPQRMLMWKMLLLGGISFLGILIIAVSISLQTDIHLLTLLYSGCIPFLLLNAFTLHLYAHDQVLQVFLTVYGLSLIHISKPKGIEQRPNCFIDRRVIKNDSKRYKGIERYPSCSWCNHSFRSRQWILSEYGTTRGFHRAHGSIACRGRKGCGYDYPQ